MLKFLEPAIEKEYPLMKPLVQYCAGALESLNAHYQMSKVLKHSATAGAVRERFIQDFLISHLPEMTTVTSGVILDHKNERSKQQDLVLVIKSMPRLPFSSGHDLIFQEGVVATCEIKTAISPSVLLDIASNIQSVKKLESSALGGVLLGELGWPMDRIFSIIVTYEGSDLDVINDSLQKFAVDQQPDIYLDLARGALVKNQPPFIRDNITDIYWKESESAKALAHVLTILSTITSRVVMRNVDWKKYIEE